MCVCRAEASSGCYGNQPASLQTFPCCLAHSVVTKPSGKALSRCLWKPSKWAHYEKSRPRRKWLHAFSTYHHIHKGEENKTTSASERNGWEGGHWGMTIGVRWPQKMEVKKLPQLSTKVNPWLDKRLWLRPLTTCPTWLRTSTPSTADPWIDLSLEPHVFGIFQLILSPIHSCLHSFVNEKQHVQWKALAIKSQEAGLSSNAGAYGLT